MKRPRLRFKRRMLAWLLAPPALWGIFLALVPTEWARQRVVERLSHATGKTVRLQGLRLGIMGGVRLQNLEIGEPNSLDDPWLRASNLQIDLHLANIMFGHCQPTKVQAQGLKLRVHRLANGTLEFGNLLAKPGSQVARARSGGAQSAQETGTLADNPAKPEGCTVNFEVRDGQISLIDEPSQTTLEFTKIDARGSWDRRRAAIQDFHSQLNGGKLELVAQVDRSPELPMFEGQMRAEGVALGNSMGALGYLIPVLSQAPQSVDGQLDMNLYLRGQGFAREEIRRSLVGQGTVSLAPIRLDGSRVAAELAPLVDMTSASQAGSVQSEFSIGQGRVTSKQFVLKLGQVPFALTGWTDFDGRLDYRIRSEGLAGKLPAEARNLLADMPIDLNDILNLRIYGTLNDLVVTMGGPQDSPGSKEAAARRDAERARMREMGRRLRDRILR